VAGGDQDYRKDGNKDHLVRRLVHRDSQLNASRSRGNLLLFFFSNVDLLQTIQHVETLLTCFVFL
jgi:hypothetical protein